MVRLVDKQLISFMSPLQSFEEIYNAVTLKV